MRRQFLYTLCGVAFFLWNISGTAFAGDVEMHELRVRGQKRQYFVYQPQKVNAKAPLVIVLHGGMGNAENMIKTTGMNAIAEANGFVVIYPDGIGGKFRFMRDKRTWNAGLCCGKAVKAQVDDVKFMSRIIYKAAHEFGIDKSRVYVMGISNGAMMAYRLASEIPEKIAAIVSVAGAVATPVVNEEIKDVAVMHIHGDRDENVPIMGGEGKRSVSGVKHKSLDETMNIILKNRQCNDKKYSSEYEGKVEVVDYVCTNGAPVKKVIIKGGGHTWPGASTEKNRKNKINMLYPASLEAWKFVQQFSKP